MNPFRLGAHLPRRPLARAGLGALGLLLLAYAVRSVDHRRLFALIGTLRWSWILASLAVAFLAVTLRSLRLAWILGHGTRLGPVWRSNAIGALGRALLPLGGGEIMRIGALTTLTGLPAGTVAAGAILDKFIEALGLAAWVLVLALAGVAFHWRTGFLAPLLGTGMAILLVGGGAAYLLLRRRASGPLERFLAQAQAVARNAGRPALLSALALSQVVICLLDAASVLACLRAFPFGPGLPWIASVKVTVFTALGVALPLLPGGTGTWQVASILALSPSGVEPTFAIGYSIVAQGTAFLFACATGAVSSIWPASGPTQAP